MTDDLLPCLDPDCALDSDHKGDCVAETSTHETGCEEDHHPDAYCNPEAPDPWGAERTAVDETDYATGSRPRPGPRPMTLFKPGDFAAHSGATLHWKIECDALTAQDWEGLAVAAAEVLPSFGEVEGVPRGGIPFADALRPHATTGPLLIADDVCTSGASLNDHRRGRDSLGVVAFARGPVPEWVTPLFTLFSRHTLTYPEASRPDVLLTGEITAVADVDEDSTLSTIVAIRTDHPEPADLVGRRVVVTAAPTEDTT